MLADYLNMGGYAAFVWPAYAATAIALVGGVVVTWRQHKARERRLAELKGRPPSGPLPSGRP